MKKRIIIAAIAIFVAVLAVSLLGIIPVYPAFQKEVHTMQAVQRVLRSETILYPKLESGLENISYKLELDGRTVFQSLLRI